MQGIKAVRQRELVVLVALVVVALLTLSRSAFAASTPEPPPPTVSPTSLVQTPTTTKGTPTSVKPTATTVKPGVKGTTTSNSSSGLPVTGADVMTLVGIGLAAVGIGLLLQNRRRVPRAG